MCINDCETGQGLIWGLQINFSRFANMESANNEDQLSDYALEATYLYCMCGNTAVCNSAFLPETFIFYFFKD